MAFDPLTTVYALPGLAEPFNALSHLLGALVFALWIAWMGRGARPAGRAWLAVFGSTVVFALAMSGVYHMLDVGSVAREEVFRRLDHAGIFVLIAGTTSAAHGLLFTGIRRWGMIALLWATAATAVTLTVVFFHRIPELLSLGLYIAFGWVGALSGYEIWQQSGWRLIRPLLAGGVAYTAGAVVAFVGGPLWIPGIFGPHGFFHVCVLVGLALHGRFFRRVLSQARWRRRLRRQRGIHR